MICPHCHFENREGAKFCNECGLPLSGKIAEVAAAVDAANDASNRRDTTVSEEALDVDFAGVVSADEDQPEKPSKPSSSGPLDPASLPAIDVAGVNVDDDGNVFDFSDIDEDPEVHPVGEDVVFSRDDGLLPYVPTRPAPDADPDRTADLSGLDECLVDSSYSPPRKSWSSGDTMEMPRIEGKPAPKQKEFRAPDPNAKKRGKGKVVAIMLVCLLLIAGAAAGTTYYLEMWGGKTLPNVVGMTQADAVATLEGKGFAVSSMQVKSDETEGVVLLMDPGAGARQEEGTQVVIHVSEARTIPEAVGGQRDEVAAKLDADGFENVTYVTQKSDERKGTVLAITPEAGAKAKADTPITVTVAEPFTVPDVANMGWDDAVAAIEAAGLVAEAVYVYDDNVAPGTIVGTDPAAGTEVASGSTVTVSLAKSRGSELETAAMNYLSGIGSINLGGTTYEIQSVDGVSYQGNDATAFTITGSAVTTLDGEVVRGSAKQKSGVIVWDSANNIVSIS